MSIFGEEKPGAGPSSEAELAALMKDEPAETAAADATPEPAAQAPEPATAAEPPAEAQQQPVAAEEAPKAPNPNALARLSEENRKLKDQLGQFQGQIEAMQRMWQGQQPQQPQAQQPEGPPDPEQDPIGALKWTQDQLAKQTQISQAQALHQRVASDYATDVQQFAGKTPDFGAAYNHLLTGRVTELRHLGYNDQQIAQQVRQEEFGVALNALRQNKSPGQAIYELAKARGYTAKPVEQPKPAAPDPALQEARQKAAAGIAEGGNTPKGGMSLEDITKLSGAAFEKAIAKWERENVKQSGLFGGRAAN